MKKLVNAFKRKGIITIEESNIFKTDNTLSIDVEYVSSYYDLVRTIHNCSVTENTIENVITEQRETTGYVKGGLTYYLHKLTKQTEEFEEIYNKQMDICINNTAKSIFSLGVVCITISKFDYVEPVSNTDNVVSLEISKNLRSYRYIGSYQSILNRFKNTYIYNDIKTKIDNAIEYKYTYSEKVHLEGNNENTVTYTSSNESYSEGNLLISSDINNPIELVPKYCIINIKDNHDLLCYILQSCRREFNIISYGNNIFIQVLYFDMLKITNYITCNYKVSIDRFTNAIMAKLENNIDHTEIYTDEINEEDKYIEGVDEIVEV